MQRAALGFRVHTGWAALVATADASDGPQILERQRVEMIAGRDSKAPPYVFHAAALLPPVEAQPFIREHTAVAKQRARAAVTAVVRELRGRGFEVVAAGVIGGNRPLVSSLAQILASHALIHTAEGTLYRGAIGDACADLAIPLFTVAANELYARAVTGRIGRSPDAIKKRLTDAGRGAGKPWAQDQKESLLVALLALQKDAR